VKTFDPSSLKPFDYDDDGYVIRGWRSGVRSTTLATLLALARDSCDRRDPGDDVGLLISTVDETNTRVHIEPVARMIECDEDRGVVAMVGV
jgi:hypothetical protein